MRILETSALEVLLPGFTHHIDIGQDVDARMSFGASGQAQMVLPGKPPMTGAWTPRPDGYDVAWTNGPRGAWKIGHRAGQLTYIDPTGRQVGTVTRIEPIQPQD